ncbi:hypothetical protein K6119_04320 [Paracrocinitomix mangrovi]|uniref:hypothetical protein n=1 Tax=Paracrocinitomix mangrovi TaxID=2862509 RepID=UPI001C8E1363|nr:hypothetical protein [Paracrocinitomix mangrovi]UKN02739.1 hypothetical protein K6119_04320 [Paracrocinitomix mangrovi]
MNMLIKTFISNPKKLLLLDASGALLSAFLLGVVLVKINTVVGIPVSALYILAIIPCFFVVFDLFAISRKNEQLGRYLRIIGALNLMYCITSIVFVIIHSDSIEVLGWVYILSELIIVITLAGVEFYVSGKVKMGTINS